MLLTPTASLDCLQDCQKLGIEQVDVFLHSHFIDQSRTEALVISITEATNRPTGKVFGRALPVDDSAEEIAA